MACHKDLFSGSTNIYTVPPISNVITSFVINFYQYADDTQLYIALDRSNVDANLQDLDKCLPAIRIGSYWFLWNGHALNPDKTEVMVLRATTKLRHLDLISTVNIVGAMVTLVDTIKNLCMMLDTKLSFDKHVNKILSNISKLHGM